MKETIQRQVVVLMYVWWSERCAIREGEPPGASCIFVS
jgi:hypothetical protein